MKTFYIQSLSSNNVPKVILARDIDGLHDAELSILTEVLVFIDKGIVELILINGTSKKVLERGGEAYYEILQSRGRGGTPISWHPFLTPVKNTFPFS